MTPNIQLNQAKLAEAFRKLRAAPEDIRRTNESLMRQMAGQAGVELANATNPPFFSESSDGIAGFKDRIAKNISDAHPHASKLYLRVLKLRGPNVADAFWAILSQQGKEAANVFLASIGTNARMANFSDDYVKSKRGNKGRIPGNVYPLYLPDNQEAAKEQFIKRKQSNTGLAKAGWLKAVATITRSRAGGASLNWVRKLTGKASGTGVMTEDANGIRITLTNSTPYASDAINGKLMMDVPRRIYDRMQAAIKRQLKATLKKL